jgi:hypothetical protein
MPNENPKAKLEDLSQRFDKVKKNFSEQFKTTECETNPKDTFLNSEAMKESLSQQLDEIFHETESMKERRNELLYKPEITAEEREELDLLTEIMQDADNLSKLVNEFLLKLSQSKNTILKTGDITIIMANRAEYGITLAEILDAVIDRDFFDNPKLELLRTIPVTDEDLQITGYYGNQGFILYKYCNLTQSQKDKILNTIIASEKFNNLFDYFPFLKHANLPKNVQNKFIEKFEAFAKTMGENHGGGGDEGSGLLAYCEDADLLSGKYLDTTQKQRILKTLVFLGTGPDCEALLKNYPQYFDPASKAKAEQRIEENSLSNNKTIKDIYQLNPEILKGKKIQFVTHPFFSMPDVEGFDYRNFDQMKLFEAMMIQETKKAIQEQAADGKLGSCINAYKFFKEFQRYQQLAQQKDTITIFVMPKTYNKPHPESKNIIETLGQSSGNFYYMESDSDNSGNVKQADAKLLDKIIPPDSDITISGAYIGRCLAGTGMSLARLKGKQRVVMDYSASRPPFGDMVLPSGNSNDPSVRFQYANRTQLQKAGFPELNIGDGNPEAIKTFDDVVKFFDANKAFNDQLEEMIFASQKRRLFNQGAGHPENNIVHKR